VAIVWFMRSLSRYKLWIKSRSEPTNQRSATIPQQKQEWCVTLCWVNQTLTERHGDIIVTDLDAVRRFLRWRKKCDWFKYRSAGFERAPQLSFLSCQNTALWPGACAKHLPLAGQLIGSPRTAAKKYPMR